MKLPALLRKMFVRTPASDKVDNWVTALENPMQLVLARDSILSGTLYDQDAIFDLMLDSWERLAKDTDELSSAVAGLPSSVIPWAAKDSDPTPQDMQAAKLVEDALWGKSDIPQGSAKENFTELLKDLALCRIRGVRCHEIEWKLVAGIIAPVSFSRVSSKYYAWNTSSLETDELRFCPSGINRSSEMQDWPENKFIVAIPRENGMHPMFAAKMRKLWQWFAASHFGIRWYMQYAQQFGAPFRTARAATETGRAKAAELLKKMGNAAWMVVPPEVQLEITDHTAGGGSPYIELLERADAVCDNLILGQSLTSSRGEGGSYALGRVHEGIRMEVIKHSSDDVESIINSQLIPAILRMNYGSSMPEHMPRFAFTIPGSNVDKATLEYLTGAINLGLTFSEEFARDMLKIPAPKQGERVLGGNDVLLGGNYGEE